MRKRYFFIFGFLFSVLASNGQGNGGYIGFCGHVYYKADSAATVLHWKDTCGNALYYQIQVKLSGIGWIVLDSVSGQDTSYVLPNYSDSVYKGEVYYLLAFYNGGVAAKSDEFYFVDAQTYIDTSTYSLYTNYSNAGVGKMSQSTPMRGVEVGGGDGSGGGSGGGGLLNFTYTVDNFTNVFLRWNIAAAAPVESFQIERNGEMIAKLPPDARVYTDFNLELGDYIYTLTVFYQSGEIERADLDVVLYPAVVNFDYNWVNNNLVFNWHVTADGIQPISFDLMCNEKYVASIPSVAGKFTYTYSIPNPEAGAFTYYLYAHYTTDGITVSSVDVKIDFAEIESFTAAVMDIDNVSLRWDVSQEGIAPQFFQIKRNGNIIADNITAEEREYLDTNLEEGNYSYQIISHYGGNIIPYNNEHEVRVEYLDYVLPINFRCAIENKDVLLFWNIIMGKETPVSFQIKRDDNIIWKTQDSLQYGYTDTNLAVGTYTYRLYANYANGMTATFDNTFSVMIIETSNVIEVGEGMELVVALLSEGSYQLDSICFGCTAAANSINLNWTVAADAIQPVAFDIVRNGEVIANLSGTQRVYIDSDLAVGNYVYALQAFYSRLKTPFIKTSNCTVGSCE